MNEKVYNLSSEDRELLTKDLYQRLGTMKTKLKYNPINISTDEVKKVLNNIHSHMEDYHLYRYLAFWLESKERNKDIRQSIASWMVHSRHKDLPFNDIFVIDDEVYIYTYRPGLWIGKGGCTINDCLYHINHKTDGTEYRKLNIHLIEAKDDAITDVYGYMRICQPYSDVNEYWNYISDSDIKMAKNPDSNKITTQETQSLIKL